MSLFLELGSVQASAAVCPVPSADPWQRAVAPFCGPDRIRVGVCRCAPRSVIGSVWRLPLCAPFRAQSCGVCRRPILQPCAEERAVAPFAGLCTSYSVG